MAKNEWAKGRKDPTLLVRLDADIHQGAKEEAKKSKMTLKAWISECIRSCLIIKKS
jgi:predicted HicB family RNase H-like nuclease